MIQGLNWHFGGSVLYSPRFLRLQIEEPPGDGSQSGRELHVFRLQQRIPPEEGQSKLNTFQNGASLLTLGGLFLHVLDFASLQQFDWCN